MAYHGSRGRAVVLAAIRASAVAVTCLAGADADGAGMEGQMLMVQAWRVASTAVRCPGLGTRALMGYCKGVLAAPLRLGGHATGACTASLDAAWMQNQMSVDSPGPGYRTVPLRLPHNAQEIRAARR